MEGIYRERGKKYVKKENQRFGLCDGEIEKYRDKERKESKKGRLQLRDIVLKERKQKEKKKQRDKKLRSCDTEVE